jgi:hypothetical protein
MKNTVFWDMMLCILLEIDRCFGEPAASSFQMPVVWMAEIHPDKFLPEYTASHPRKQYPSGKFSPTPKILYKKQSTHITVQALRVPGA